MEQGNFSPHLHKRTVNDKSLHNPTPGIILKLAQYDMKRKCPYTRKN